MRYTHLFLISISLIVACHVILRRLPSFPAKSMLHGDYPSQAISPIDSSVFDNLILYAQLIDISYCIDTYHQIDEPFECGLCGPGLANMSLVTQWYFDDAVCGFIGKTYSNIFNNTYSGVTGVIKTLVISLRGTRSLYDTIADLMVEMTKYEIEGDAVPPCGRQCKVHSGFMTYYRNTLRAMEDVLLGELQDVGHNYQLVFVGHSMGGSVALLLSLHFLSLGFNNTTLVTMGSPLIGNKQFTTWTDEVLGSKYEAKHNSFHRKYLRVIHKEDIVTTVPRKGNLLEAYHHFDNQIYINTTAESEFPERWQVVDCHTEQMQRCIASDFASIFDKMANFYRAHNTYFRRLGHCGIISPFGGI